MTAFLSLRDAVAEYVRDGMTIAVEGFTHLIPFAAGHEIMRQQKRDQDEEIERMEAFNSSVWAALVSWSSPGVAIPELVRCTGCVTRLKTSGRIL